MKVYTEKELSHWESIDIYRLDVKKAKDFISEVIVNLPNDCLISFEGDMNKIQKPDLVIDIENTQNIRRNTIAPRLDFWIFKIDEDTKDYLTNDFINRVGIRDNVVHISVEHDSKLILNSNDNFDSEGVFISCGKFISYDLLKRLEQDNVINEIEKLKTAPNKGYNA